MKVSLLCKDDAGIDQHFEITDVTKVSLEYPVADDYTLYYLLDTVDNKNNRMFKHSEVSGFYIWQ